MSAHADREICIHGVTHDGRHFRPGDWAERVAGVMRQFHPGSSTASRAGAAPGYSPWCRPCLHNGVKCLVVKPELREYEPMAWDFVLKFARDNHLPVTEKADDTTPQG